MEIEYRVVKHQRKYHIQRKEIQETTKGMWWWKKTSCKDVWKSIAKNGDCLYYTCTRHFSMDNHDQAQSPFDDLDSALDVIDKFMEPNLHYYPQKGRTPTPPEGPKGRRLKDSKRPTIKNPKP